MVGNDNYCLTLNEFEVNADIYWEKLQNEKDFCDVTLVCEDKNIKTHKFIYQKYQILELHGPSRALAILAAPQGFASLRYATLRFAPRSLFK